MGGDLYRVSRLEHSRPATLSDYRIVVNRSAKIVRQRFWVSIVAANGKTLFHSEQYKSQNYAREIAHQIAAALDGNYIDLT